MTEQEILRFARNRIRSIWTLEVLVLLCETRGDQWRVEQLVRESRSSAGAVFTALDCLGRLGMVREASEELYQFEPKSQELEALALQLRDLYKSKPTTVVNALFGAVDEKLQIFAGAFKLKE